MLTQDVPSKMPPPAHQRARGCAEVAFSRREGAIRLDRLYQAGCAKALLPRTYGADPEIVLINTAGGVTGGDRIDYGITAGTGSRLVATTQAAERIYRAAEGSARIETRLTLGPGATLDWLPQETILFDGSRLTRRLRADLAEDATLTALEMLMFGRAAMGESVATGALSDTWEIRRGGRLVHMEALRVVGDIARAAAGSATLAGNRALATLVVAGPDAGDRLMAARARLAHLDGVLAAASAKDDVLILRFLAPDLTPLRAALTRFLMAFRSVGLPRVWTA